MHTTAQLAKKTLQIHWYSTKLMTDWLPATCYMYGWLTGWLSAHLSARPTRPLADKPIKLWKYLSLCPREKDMMILVLALPDSVILSPGFWKKKLRHYTHNTINDYNK